MTDSITLHEQLDRMPARLRGAVITLEVETPPSIPDLADIAIEILHRRRANTLSIIAGAAWPDPSRIEEQLEAELAARKTPHLLEKIRIFETATR